ncbi:MAG: glycosyltransferase family 2 protein [Chloroflexi bacterium]|nr:glycosyltransferase family 2 protein [Chloroflexota bacterium]MCY3937361.1 glycosyltransferase family 2 protein [Chloroflexota bacterium]
MPLRDASVSVIIPAKNEEQTVGEVIESVREYADEVLVVDGRSEDATPTIATELGARLIEDHGRGKGDAVRLAIREAAGDILVFVDADLSHEPTDIPKLVAPIRQGEADLVVGSRPRGGSDEMTGDLDRFIRWFGQQIIQLGINYRFGVRLTDAQNGFRSISKRVAADLDLRENLTTIEQEMVMKVLKKGYKIAEVPSHEFERGAGRSKISIRRTWHRYVYQWLRDLIR